MLGAVPSRQRQVVLARHPEGQLEESHFALVEGPVPSPGDGEALCRTVFLSIDPANRAWMNGRTYRAALGDGEVMSGFTISEVVDPGGSGLAAGTLVMGDTGWQEYAAVDAAELTPFTPSGPLSQHLGILGITGLTAYFGLLEIGRPLPGDTVVISAAAGATGNVAGQLARIAGARVVGVAGSDEKCEFLARELGFDAAVNHRDPDLRGALKAACPDGVDVYFDSVAGAVLDAVLLRMNRYGRIICCGAVAQYDGGGRPVGPVAVPGLVITQRLRMEGFIVLDYAERFPAATARLARLIDQGRLRVLEDVIDGLEEAPRALIGLLAGANVGKRVVRVGPDPVR